MGKVEEVAASVVREYLSRKGMKKTLSCLDEELPRTNMSINNRSDLCKVLRLESLYKKNKSEENPLKSMLEIMVKERMKRGGEEKRLLHLEEIQSSQEDHNLATPGSPSTVNDMRRERDLTDPHANNLSLSESSGVVSELMAQETTKETHSTKSSMTASSLSLSSGSERETFPSSSSQDILFSPTAAEVNSVQKSAEMGGQRGRISRLRKGVMTGPIVSSSQLMASGKSSSPLRGNGTVEESNRKRSGRKTTGSLSVLTKPEEDAGILECVAIMNDRQTDSDGFSAFERLSNVPSTSHQPPVDGKVFGRTPRLEPHKNKSTSSPRLDGLHMAGMVLDDIDDEDEQHGHSTVTVINTLPQLNLNKHPMDQPTATALKEIIFGSAKSCFSEEWKRQSFTFSDAPALRYGIVQKKGGPCGVLAAVQATVIQKLLFERPSSDLMSERLNVSDSVRSHYLTEALSEILWRAGDRNKATVAVNSGRSLFTPVGPYRSEGVLETMTLVDVESLAELKLLLRQHIQQFESGPFGCILLLVSAALSRRIQMVRSDMDVATSTLIGAHGYCTQELVNLLLCGQAVSNVFDDEMKLDSGNGNFTLLKGVSKRCKVGLLSLFEHYDICRVGSYLKTPSFPVWVVCSESHFSVLFSLSEDLTASQWSPKEFDLYYYDGLANQEEPIRLTVYPNSSASASVSQDMDVDLTPPLELCIRTRWADAVVSWNESEPIL